MKWRNKKVGLSLLASVLLLSSLLGYQYALSSVPASGTYYLDVPFGTASYYVGKFDNGTTYMVDGDTWQAVWWSINSSAIINACIGNLTSGGEIFVKAGTYTLTATIHINNDNITLQGEGVSTLFYVADSTQINAIRVLEVTGVTIIELRINGNKANNDESGDVGIQHGIDLNTCTYSMISRVLVENCEHTGINIYRGGHNEIVNNIAKNNGESHATCGSGIDLYQCNYTIVSTNICSSNFVNGIYVDALNYTTVDANICEANTGSGNPSGAIGILLNQVSYVTASGNVLKENGRYGMSIATSSSHVTASGNTVCDNTNEGIFVETVTHSTVSMNTMEGNGGEGIYVNSGSNNAIVGNTVKNNGEYAGIMLYNTAHNTISDNTISGETNTGIILNTVIDSTVKGNSVSDNIKHGITIQDSNYTVVEGNVISDNDVDDSASYDGIYLTGNSDNNIIASNICQGNDRYQINISVNTCDNNLIHGNRSDDTGATGGINDAGTGTSSLDNFAT